MNLRYLLSAMCVVCACALLHAQETRSEYLFDDFTDAIVQFKGNARSAAKMNYSLMTNKFYFLDTDGEIKDILNLADVITINIGNRIFYPEKDGCVEILPTTPTIYVQYKARVRPEAVKGAYGSPGETSAITALSEISGGGQRVKLKGRQLEMGGLYNIYWIERNNKKKQFVNFKQFMKLYPSHKEALEQYIDEQKLNFQDVPKIVELCMYAESL